MKKIFLVSAFILFLGLAPHVFAATAQGFTALAPIPGLTDANTVGSVNGIGANTLAIFFNNLYKYLIGLAAILAILQIIWAGIKMAYFNKDSVSAIKKGRETIQQAILGLVLVLLPVLVFSIINPSILNLSLNLPALDTSSGIPIGTGGGASTPSNVAGCIQTTGPASGTLFATCTASDLSIAQSEAGDFISNNCPISSTMTGAAVSSSCTNYTTIVNNGSVVKNCVQATAFAYCSPIVTVNIVQKINRTVVGTGIAGTAITTYTDLGYFGENVPFTIACKGGKWSLTRAGGTATTINRGTKIDCQTSDPSYQKIVSSQNQGTSLECASVPVFCQYLN